METPFTKVTITINLLICMVQNVYSEKCYSLFHGSYETFCNKRLVGNMIASISGVGPQMCLDECNKRTCGSINYNMVDIACELNSGENLEEGVALFQSNPYFIFINTTNISANDERSAFQTTDLNRNKQGKYVCSTLKSMDIECLEGISPRDCKDIHVRGSTSSGVYVMYPTEDIVIRAHCDMQTEDGGWTTFQRRMNGSVDFFRNWDDYKNGFGDVNGNYWLGNDNLHILLSNGESEMRMDMEDFNGSRRYIQYSSFVVGNEASGYQATVLGPSGNVGNCLTDTEQALSSTRFSTKDRDPKNCANRYKGGWWYVACHCTNPNGLYLSGEFDESLYAQGMVYSPWMGAYYSLKTFTMMIRRKD